MKRLNPQTNQPFKYGDLGENGKIFYGYRKDKFKQTEYIPEVWITKNQFEKNKNDKKIWRLNNPEKNSKEYRAKYKGRYTHHQYYETSKIKPDNRASILLRAAKQRCKITNGVITITKEWISNKIQKGYCEITGLPFDLHNSNKFRTNPYSPSLDRIDSKNKNYTIENTRVVLTAVNFALSEFGMEIMQPIMEKMVQSSVRSSSVFINN